MVRPTWATREQWDFLEANVPQREAAQECKRTAAFQLAFNEAWFEKFPCPMEEREGVRAVSHQCRLGENRTNPK